MSVLSKKYFHNEKAAFDHMEKILWAEGVICPHCGSVDRASKMRGKSTRLGLWKCYGCRKQFTVRVGTVFESAHIPLSKCLQALYLMSASKKGCSAHQLHRTLEITYKSAWFLAHRIREAMRDGTLAPMGGPGSIVEADETYFGPTKEQPEATTSGRPFKGKGRFGPAGKRAILSLVQRGGNVRSFHVDRADADTVAHIVRTNVSRESILSTDESRLYTKLGKEFETHMSVNHAAKEYVRGEAHTNTVEGVFSIFKRGMKGVYQHCSEKHLHRYLAEFDFRYNNRVALGVDDESRTDNAVKGIVGKRLTYRAADQEPTFDIPF
jgi:transposase-like protein